MKNNAKIQNKIEKTEQKVFFAQKKMECFHLLFLYPYYFFILSIAFAVCDISDAIVIGPTPPGTGV